MDRMFNVMKDTGVLLSLTTDLRQFLYLANKVEQDRVDRSKAAQQQATRAGSR